MKRFAWLLSLVTIVAMALPTFAQDTSNVIVLNDANPTVDVVITLPPNTTGTIALRYAGATVELLDVNNTRVFYASDARLHGIELNIAPNTGTHTLKIQRITGVSEASITITSTPELTQAVINETSLTQDVTLAQGTTFSLDTQNLTHAVNITIPTATVGMVSALFPNATASTQVIDSNNMPVVESVGGHVDGYNLLLDSGNYQFSVTAQNLTAPTNLVVSATLATDVTPIVVENVVTPTPSAVVTPCTATVAVNATNLRSGPGTAYSILGYGYFNETFTVGGQNPEANWLVIGNNTTSAWVFGQNVQTQGDCSNLTVFNIPLQDATTAPIVIGQSTSTETEDDHHETEHDDENEGEGKGHDD